MKRREDGKRERGDRIQPESFASDAAVRAGDFHCVWFLEPPAACRAREIHCVVAFPFLVDRRGYRLGDVPLLAVSKLPKFPLANPNALNWRHLTETRFPRSEEH